ncbi:hypothetical protein FSS13T_08270 [Flavobacterium saliperosum S13]|uniref:Uncharacterized protein n=1 Tax=Flavobacterium saliperosum S13 TaxID=1341155 RepID=A0ABP2ZYJ5_9FLAO|nr:hypothetical protein FSS13T_08270 [Flavobacterium saliperosum S13]
MIVFIIVYFNLTNIRLMFDYFQLPCQNNIFSEKEVVSSN